MALLPKVKLKAQVNFPATVNGGAGIDVDKANGVYTIDLDYTDFAPPVAGISDPANQGVLLFNSLTGNYSLVTVTSIAAGGAVPEAPNDGVQYGRQSLSWTPITGAGAFVLKTGDTMSGNLTIAEARPELILNKSGDANVIRGQKNGLGRWSMVFGDGIAESGSDSGSNFNLANHSDAGAGKSVVLECNRVSGLFTVLADPTAPLGIATKAYVDAHTGGGGSGDVVGPASAVADRVAVFNGTTGKLIKDGGQTLSAFAAVSHTHVAANITDFSEAVDDRVGALLVAGSNITLTYNDPSNTLTIAASGGGSVTPAALTKVDDTNVTLALGGTPATALLQATSLTLGWTGTLSAARGGNGTATGISTAAQTAIDTKVAKAGDTMTGALVLNNAITVSWKNTSGVDGASGSGVTIAADNNMYVSNINGDLRFRAGAGPTTALTVSSTNVNIPLTTATNSTGSTGALTVAGGVGILGNVTMAKATPTVTFNASNDDARIDFTNAGTRTWLQQSAAGGFFFYNNDFSAGCRLANQSATGWTTLSDARIKDEVVTLSVLETLGTFRAVRYLNKLSGAREIGIIAQEQVGEWPELITQGSDNEAREITSLVDPGVWGAQYDRFGVIALQAVKELLTRVTELEAKIAVLEATK